MLVLATALGAALVLVHSGTPQDKSSALARVSSSTEAASTPAPQSQPRPMADPPSDSPEGFGATPQSFAPASAPGTARAFQPMPPPPPIDWNALVAAVVATRSANVQAASSPVALADRVSGELQRATTLVTNLVLYAAYSQDGQNFLSQLQNSLDAAGLPAIAAAGSPQLPESPQVDFSGLSAVYEAISAQPPLIGFTGPPPELPPSQGPEQAGSEVGLPVPLDPQAPQSPSDMAFLVQPTPPPPIWLPSIAPMLGFPF